MQGPEFESQAAHHFFKEFRSHHCAENPQV
jgi:hypothetical protein